MSTKDCPSPNSHPHKNTAPIILRAFSFKFNLSCDSWPASTLLRSLISFSVLNFCYWLIIYMSFIWFFEIQKKLFLVLSFLFSTLATESYGMISFSHCFLWDSSVFLCIIYCVFFLLAVTLFMNMLLFTLLLSDRHPGYGAIMNKVMGVDNSAFMCIYTVFL